jgi:hypothetical protein
LTSDAENLSQTPQLGKTKAVIQRREEQKREEQWKKEKRRQGRKRASITHPSNQKSTTAHKNEKGANVHIHAMVCNQVRHQHLDLVGAVGKVEWRKANVVALCDDEMTALLTEEFDVSELLAECVHGAWVERRN